MIGGAPMNWRRCDRTTCDVGPASAATSTFLLNATTASRIAATTPTTNGAKLTRLSGVSDVDVSGV
jgi:hypothetical protein